MKHVTILTTLLLAAASVHAAKDKKPPDITGSWKEMTRMSRDKSIVPFTDTMFTDFLIGNEYTTGRRTGFMYKGTYKLTTGTLDLGMRMYNITEITPNRMTLKDDAGFYIMERYVKADPSVENSSAASSTTRGHQEPELAGGPVSLAQLRGNWEVFKRTSSETLPEVNYKKLIRSLNVKGDKPADSSGVYSASDMAGRPSWFVTRYADNVIYCAGASGSRELKVLKCSDGELIVQEGIMTYFFKQFKN